MINYVARRMGQAVVVVLGVSVLVFSLLHALPGGPARAILGTHFTPQRYAVLSRQLGLNLPVWQQYLIWADQVVHLNLGYSYVLDVPVFQVIADSLPNSVFLVGLGTLEALCIAVPLGIYQALRRNTTGDYALTTINFFLYSMPIFWIGLMAILWLAVTVPIFPVGGLQAPGEPGFDVVQRLYHVALPSLVLAAVQVAAWSRYMRSSMLDAIVQDYIRTARAKGLSTFQTVVRHALRNALIPIITLVGLSLPTLFGGALVTESVFNYPGIGWTFWTATQQEDFPILLAIVLIVSLTTVVGNLLADILYAVVDPRVRYG